MFYYFGYGSNMDMVSLRAKGVEPVSSQKAILPGWKLRFNVEHFFRHEGGMGNIEPTGNVSDNVHGVAHLCRDEAMDALDIAEAYGIGYDRINVEAKTHNGPIDATVYVGYSSFINDNCRPTQRYLNILIKGAKAAGLENDYIVGLENLEPLKKRQYPKFDFPNSPGKVFNEESIGRSPLMTAIGGAVFDLSNARPRHEYVKSWFGGKDVTLFHLKRMDSSDGSECVDDLRFDRLSARQREYLNEYLHEFNAEYEYAGRYEYIDST